MIARLELDNFVVSTFNVSSLRSAYTKAYRICIDFESGGVLMIDGKDYGEFDFFFNQLQFHLCEC